MHEKGVAPSDVGIEVPKIEDQSDGLCVNDASWGLPSYSLVQHFGTPLEERLYDTRLEIGTYAGLCTLTLADTPANIPLYSLDSSTAARPYYPSSAANRT